MKGVLPSPLKPSDWPLRWLEHPYLLLLLLLFLLLCYEASRSVGSRIKSIQLVLFLLVLSFSAETIIVTFTPSLNVQYRSSPLVHCVWLHHHHFAKPEVKLGIFWWFQHQLVLVSDLSSQNIPGPSCFLRVSSCIKEQRIRKHVSIWLKILDLFRHH